MNMIIFLKIIFTNNIKRHYKMLGRLSRAVTNSEPTNTKVNTKPKEIMNNLIDYDAYKNLDSFIKNRNLDMRTTTGTLSISNILGSTLDDTKGMLTIPLKANLYAGIVLNSEYTISGGPTDVAIRSPLLQVTYKIVATDGSGEKLINFDRDAIDLFQVMMAKSNAFKGLLQDTNVWERNAGSVTSIGQPIFLPLPGAFGFNSNGFITEKLLPIRTSSISELRLTFANNTNQWVTFTGGTNPSISWTSVPEMRISTIASARTKIEIFNWFQNRRVPVWNVSALANKPINGTGSSFGNEVVSPEIPSNINLSFMTMAIHLQTDLAFMNPIEIKSSGELGIYKDSDTKLTGNTTALKLKMYHAFDTLPNDNQDGTYYINVVTVGDKNPFSISEVSRDIMRIDSTDYKFKIPSIDSGLTADDYYVRFVVYKIDTVQY